VPKPLNAHFSVDKSTKLFIGIVACALEGEATKRLFGTLFLDLTICLHRKHIRWVVLEQYKACMQLQQIGPLETYCFPTLAVNKLTIDI